VSQVPEIPAQNPQKLKGRESIAERACELISENRCGWGSGALYFAEVFPNSKITAFSNSKTQKIYIDEKAKEKGFTNVQVITGNVVDYEFEKESFDRVVSIEVCFVHLSEVFGLVIRERHVLMS